MTQSTRPRALTGGTVVTPDRCIDDGTLTFASGRIESVCESRDSAPDAVDVSGKYVFPGLVDIHGDDIERHLFPRPEAEVAMETAVRESERAALGAGVTTKLHAIPFENAPDDQRSVTRSIELSRVIRGRRSDAPIDQRVHARCELADQASVSAVQRMLSDTDVALVSLMTHRPDDGQYQSTEGLSNHFGTKGPVSDEGLKELVRSRQRVTETTLSHRCEAVIDGAQASGVPVALHDPEDAEAVDRAGDSGVSICEFPLTLGAARRARERGMTVTAGSPNLVRGGSLWGNLAASEAIDAGVVDVLCSDFRPQTLVQSIFTDTGEPLPTRVNRVSANPADAIGLSETGRLEAGARGNVIVVDPHPTPTVSRVFVDGVEMYRYGPNS